MDDEFQAKLTQRGSLRAEIDELQAKLDQEEKNYITEKKTLADKLQQDYNDRVNKINIVLLPIMMRYHNLDKDLRSPSRSRSSWGGMGTKNKKRNARRVSAYHKKKTHAVYR